MCCVLLLTFVSCHPCAGSSEWQRFEPDLHPMRFEEGVFPLRWTPDLDTLLVLSASNEHLPAVWDDESQAYWFWRYDALENSVSFYEEAPAAVLDVCGEPAEVTRRLPEP